ncbi:MAG: VOC family protein [Planctomycetia bacterium]|nr:VOC family protein [Planctomycetia bacterium]
MKSELYAVELRTVRWEEMLAWYRKRLGMRALIRIPEEQYALLEAGNARLALIGRDAPDETSARWSLALECDDLDEALRVVAPAGARILRNSEGYQELLVHDPDGNRVRLFSWPG